ncbi:MAG: polysaccharide biosynthesis/export family protein [Niastella sp.]|uniref:polysaccharide biosynthesis/export family protein n=1 Tax=Niastella sp. TaxID=1869183 RepID=UPI00389B2A3A
MLQTPVSRFIQACIFVVVVMFMGSCTSTKKAREELKYLDGKLDIPENLKVAVKEVVIQKGDLLSIYVYSDNPEATAIFNQQITKAGAGGATGYLVDQEGNIRFQTLGVLHVEGLTKQELMKMMDEKLKVYLTNPYTDVRFLNFHVNILGEVNKPGPYSIPEEKLTILELVGLAGDLTIYGRRDNLLVIREKEGKREFGQINLKDPNLFQSPYFSLQQNDVVMVYSNERKQTGSDQQLYRNLTIVSAVASLVSIVAIVYNILR